MKRYNFRRKLVATLGGMAVALFLNSPALATITYTGALSTATISSTYHITTDGTIGTLIASNIVDWDVTIFDPGGNINFSKFPFGHTYFNGTALSATTTDLYFNYGASGANTFTLSNYNDANFVDFETQDAPLPDFYGLRQSFGQEQFVPQFGIHSIASVASGPIGAVPEPGTWATMLLGFGAIGFSVRRRRKARGIAQLV